MTDDLAVEPAPIAGPARRVHVLGGLTSWLLVAIAAVGMLASTPPSAGPDEPVHEVSAWYLSEHGLPPRSSVWFSVPAALWLNPCYGAQPATNASCMAPRDMNRGMVEASTIVNYPPPYYWVVGLGERLAALVGNEYADIGGRLASIILNFGALLLLSLYMRRRNPLWGSFLLLVSTPMAVFLGIVVNPSGWEITCGVIMAAVLSEAAWRLPPIESDAWPKTTTAILALASLGLSTARPLGFLWASGLTVTAIALAPSMNRRTLARLATAVTPGIALGLLWALTHPASSTANSVTTPSTLPNLANWFVESLLTFPEFLRHTFGVLGWLDTPMPGLLLLLSIASWAVLLTRLPSIGIAAKVCGIFGIVILPSAISALGWAAYPAWWQGRYSMPFAVGFVLLLLLRSGRLIPRMTSIVAGISVLSLGVMVWVNAIRYGFGLDGYDLPASLGKSGISGVRLGISAAIGLVLVLVSGYLLVNAWRTKHDLPQGLEPEILSTPRKSELTAGPI
jgi:hypothetical protein